MKLRIPKEGHSLLSGITDIAEAWQVLDNYYGNHKMIINSVIEKLHAVKLVKGSAHNSLEQLCQASQGATCTLREVGAGSCLEYDRGLVATLIAKLTEAYTIDWDKHNALILPRARSTWRKFVGCALGMRELSNSAKAREAQQALYKDTIPPQGGRPPDGGGGSPGYSGGVHPPK